MVDMNVICKMIDERLEVGMEFDVYYDDGKKSPWSPYKLIDGGLYNCDDVKCSGVLGAVIVEDYTIKLPKWKPKKGDKCYIADNHITFNVRLEVWHEYDYQVEALDNYLVFRNEEEFLKATKKMVELWKEWNDDNS